MWLEIDRNCSEVMSLGWMDSLGNEWLIIEFQRALMGWMPDRDVVSMQLLFKTITYNIISLIVIFRNYLLVTFE